MEIKKEKDNSKKKEVCKKIATGLIATMIACGFVAGWVHTTKENIEELKRQDKPDFVKVLEECETL